ncbi:MAG: DUF1801 domain-containing protein [Pirellulaceae bacterium]
MRVEATSVKDYVSQLPEERRPVIEKMRKVVRKNLSREFKECMSYGMIGYVIPHSIYPAGYHCDPKLPLPFMNIASQKNFVALYHMGLYADPDLMAWFTAEYPNHCQRKLDMGKSCIRFKKIDEVPYGLIGELAGKMTAAEWIQMYESNFKK